MSFWKFKRSNASARLLVEYGQEQGLDADTLIAGTGLSRVQLEDPAAEVSATQELRIVANLLDALHDRPGMGLEVGMRYSFSSYGLWGFGVISSATARDAIKLGLRFLPLTYAFTQVSYKEGHGQSTLTFLGPDLRPQTRRFLLERDMAAAVRLMHETVGDEFRLVAMTLRSGKPPPASTRARMERLAGTAITWNAPSDSIVAERSLLGHRLPQANLATAAMCERACAELMERRRATMSTADLVRYHLASAPANHPPSLPEAARLLNLSERTLKRRLLEEGHSFRTLLAESRAQRARSLVLNESLSLTEIAEFLGFSDLSSFSQAFKRWYGASPDKMRQSVAKDASASGRRALQSVAQSIKPKARPDIQTSPPIPDHPIVA